MGPRSGQYGRLGETVYEKKTVTTFTNATHPSVYETPVPVRDLRAALEDHYPDGEVVTNTYDFGGNLTNASGVKAVAASGQNHRYQFTAEPSVRQVRASAHRSRKATASRPATPMMRRTGA